MRNWLSNPAPWVPRQKIWRIALLTTCSALLVQSVLADEYENWPRMHWFNPDYDNTVVVRKEKPKKVEGKQVLASPIHEEPKKAEAPKLETHIATTLLPEKRETLPPKAEEVEGPQGDISLPNGEAMLLVTKTAEHIVGENEWLRSLIKTQWSQKWTVRSPRVDHLDEDSYTATYLANVPDFVSEAFVATDLVLVAQDGDYIGYVKYKEGFIAFRFGSGSGGFGSIGSLSGKQSPISWSVDEIRFEGVHYQNYFKKTMNDTPFWIFPSRGGTDGADILTSVWHIIGEIYFHGSSARINGPYSGGCFRLRSADIIILRYIWVMRPGMKFQVLEF